MANPNTDVVVLQALAGILTPGTSFATKGGAVYIKQKYLLANGVFPALLLTPGPQYYRRNSLSSFDGEQIAIVKYYDQWAQSQQLVDAIYASIAADLEIMLANVLHNDSLTTGGIARGISIYKATLSTYEGEVEDVDALKLITRSMELYINILPFDA